MTKHPKSYNTSCKLSDHSEAISSQIINDVPNEKYPGYPFQFSPPILYFFQSPSPNYTQLTGLYDSSHKLGGRKREERGRRVVYDGTIFLSQVALSGQQGWKKLEAQLLSLHLDQLWRFLFNQFPSFWLYARARWSRRKQDQH